MPTRRFFVKQVALATGLSSVVTAEAAPTGGSSEISNRKTDAGVGTFRISGTELTISRIGYACSSLIPWDRSSVSAADVVTGTRLIRAACESGITLFDHADLYAFGKAEAVFGEVLRQSPGLRDRLVIQSKCGQRFPNGWQSGSPIRIDLSREHIVSSTEGSLRRLATDRLDILLLHAADTLAQPDEIAEAFEKLYRGGKVRYFGVTNYNAAQIELLRKSVRQPICINQFRLGLAHPYPLMDGMELAYRIGRDGKQGHGYSVASSETIDYCRMNSITIFAAVPLDGIPEFPSISLPGRERITKLLAEVAATKGTTQQVIGLAWLLRHPSGFVPIVTRSDLEKNPEITGVEGVTLSHDEWHDLFASVSDPERVFG